MDTIIKQLEEDLRKAIEENIDLNVVSDNVVNFHKARQSHLVKRVHSTLNVLVDEISITKPLDASKLLKQVTSLKQNSIGKKAKFRFPDEVRADMQADYDEMNKCLDSGCYRSAIILCGRLLETALHRKYYEATGKDLLEKAPGIGLGNVIGKLSEQNVPIDPGLSNQIHLINQVRIHSVHKKKQGFIPSEAQTRAIVMYTMDVIGRLF